MSFEFCNQSYDKIITAFSTLSAYDAPAFPKGLGYLIQFSGF